MVAPDPDGSLPSVRATGAGLLVGVRVSPNAKRTRLLGLYGDRLKVQVGAPPENQRANSQLRAAVADWLGLPLDYVVLHSGDKSKDKVLAFRSIGQDELRQRLARLLEAGRS